MSLEQDILALQAAPIIGQLDAEALRLVAFSGEKREARAGEELIRAGHPLLGGMVILSGATILVPGGEFGGRARVAGPGELLGDTALVLETIAPFSVTAREPTSVLLVPRRLFKRVLAEYPSNARAIRAAFAARLQRLQLDLARVAQKLEAIDAEAPRPKKQNLPADV